MNALVSGVIGGVLAAVLVTAGITTYNAASSSDEPVADANAVSYADE